MLRGQAAEHVLDVGGELRVTGHRDVGKLRRDGADGLPRDPDCLPDGDRPGPAHDRGRLAELAEIAEDRDQCFPHRIWAILHAGWNLPQQTSRHDSAADQLRGTTVPPGWSAVRG